ncbi:hypothetical protein QV12_00195 [Pseudomonas putida]|nr:hypothetical protein QV12_00195 [Pseudomonas putida]
MHRIGRFVFQGHMGPFCVVDLYCLINHLPRLLQIFRATQQQLHLEDSVDSLSQRVLVAVIPISHGALNAVPLVQ